MDMQALSEPLYRAKFWMKLVAVMMIIYGVLCALSLVGIIIAWLPIWMGVLLFQSTAQVERAHMASDDQAMLTALSKLKTYFTITGVLLLVGILIWVIGIVVVISAGLMSASQFN